MQPLTVVLAGGEGSRMGGDKPRRLLAGEPLLSHALRLARNWSDEVRVAVRSADQLARADAPLLIDDPDVWGPLAGLTSALQEARRQSRKRVLTVPCDMPFLPTDLPERLASAIGDHGAALAASEGQLHPVCGLWSVRALDAIASYRASGRRSLKGLAEAVGFVAVDWPAALFVNLNTPEELDEAERRLRSEAQP